MIYSHTHRCGDKFWSQFHLIFYKVCKIDPVKKASDIMFHLEHLERGNTTLTFIKHTAIYLERQFKVNSTVNGPPLGFQPISIMIGTLLFVLRIINRSMADGRV